MSFNKITNFTNLSFFSCEVVIVRIFWNVNRSWTGRITAHELRRSDFLPTLHLLETVADINKITDYFSYEHFYVAYCKFWELDTDHDMVINRDDMRQHCNGAITDAIIDRIFSGAVMRNTPKFHVKAKGPCRAQKIETIGFEDFVSFLLAEEDKKHPTSIEYWFRIIDLDGDGVLSLYEMEYFYREIEKKLIQHNFDTLSFRDVACNVNSIFSKIFNNFQFLVVRFNCTIYSWLCHIERAEEMWFGTSVLQHICQLLEILGARVK